MSLTNPGSDLLAALEHARDPGVDPALPLLARAVEEIMVSKAPVDAVRDPQLMFELIS
jgi:hypothetical protein